MSTPAEEIEVIEATAQISTEEVAGILSDARWLSRAKELYRASTDYYQTSLFTNWSDNIAHFRSEHPSGSKYTQDAYKHRSKVFRPKPRSAMRTLEASAAAALFTNDDLLAVTGVDKGDALQAESSRLHQALLQHRLEVSIPWFLTVLGAFQDTNVYGVCISRQYWDYRSRKKTDIVPATDEQGNPISDDDGTLLGYEQITERILADKPAIDLIAPENFRFDPACDWRDPVGTSPYLIERIPMYAGQVIAMTEQQGWHEYDLAKLCSHGAGTEESDSVRNARERSQANSKEVNTSGEYSTVWIHFNIIRDSDGQDWCFYTVGTGLLLSQPVPLEEFDPLERKRYTVGISSIEAHKAHPDSLIQIGRPLTDLTNDVTNQRMDNVKLVLNKRYKLRRNSNIDVAALMRNTPGGGVVMDDIEKDLGIIDTPDITQSSYVEQDRLNVESDELLGTFSQSSVQNNRALNETVGGMNLMASGATAVQELGLRTFIETWVEPVLRTLVKLEGLYETDQTILALAAGKAEIHHEIDDELLLQDLIVRVNVGIGNTNPQQKMQRFLEPLGIIKDLPEIGQRINYEEVGKELFALSGQGNAARFVLTDEQVQEKMDGQGEQQDPRVQIEQMRAQLKQMEMEIRQAETEQDGILRQMKIEADKELGMAKIAAEQNIKMSALYEKLGIDRESLQLKAQLEQSKIQTQRDIAALRSQYDNLKTVLQAKNLRLGYDTFG
jgi:hypothetical protein